MAGRQSLGEFLSSSGLTMASFAGLTLSDALDLARLDDGCLGSFSRDRRDRALAIRSDLIAALKRGGTLAETDAPGTIDQETGKPRKKSKKEAEEQEPDETASSDDFPEPSPVPEHGPPSSSAWRAVPAAVKINALMIVNAGRARRGLPPLRRLEQDEPAATSYADLPRDREELARMVVNAGRSARGMKAITDAEWVSVRELRGER